MQKPVARAVYCSADRGQTQPVVLTANPMKEYWAQKSVGSIDFESQILVQAEAAVGRLLMMEYLESARVRSLLEALSRVAGKEQPKSFLLPIRGLRSDSDPLRGC
jgi:hypothetical protein